MAGVINIVDALLKRRPEVLIIGDVIVSGSLNVSQPAIFKSTITASMFTGSGAGLFDIPESALSFSPSRIASGSVTASVSPNFGLKVESSLSGSQFTGSVDISGSLRAFKVLTNEVSGSDISGSFQGDGSRLTGIIVSPQVATKIVSGSVTASVSPNTGLIVTSLEFGSTFSGSINLSGSIFAYGNISIISGSFTGSGAGLFDIPESALSFTPNKITSGSVTASVSPQFGFKVESIEKGTQFTGSLFISGAGVFLNSGSFSGSGKNLFDIPISALSNLDTSKIFSGSVTASISPNRGFEVFAATSNFSGSISASVFSGSGIGLFNIPQSAISSEVFRIVSGSVTASVSPNFGFRVTSVASGSDFSGSIRIDSSSFIYSCAMGTLPLRRMNSP
jgi:hypothetical protein